MTKKPKVFLGSTVAVIFILLLVFASLLIFWPKKSASSLTITSAQNKFHLTFNIVEGDKAPLADFLQNINIGQNIQDGAKFSLDATSSAKLTFLTPVNAKLQIAKSQINYSGKLSFFPGLAESQPENLNIPKSTSLAVFAPNVTTFLKSHYSLDSKFSAWLEDNFANNSPHYLVFFGQKPDFVLAAKTKNINLQSLKELNLNEDYYKESTIGTTTLYLINFQKKNENSFQPALFSLGDWVFLASSQSAAQAIFNAQNGNESKPFFSNDQLNKTSSLIINFQNDNGLPDNFTDILQVTPQTSSARSNIQKTLNKIKEFDFALKANEFSGLIKY